MLKPEDFAADELSTGTRRHLAGSAAMRVSSKTIATRACNLESLGMLPCSSVNLRRAAQGTATDRAETCTSKYVRLPVTRVCLSVVVKKLHSVILSKSCDRFCILLFHSFSARSLYWITPGSRCRSRYNCQYRNRTSGTVGPTTQPCTHSIRTSHDFDFFSLRSSYNVYVN